ncbi:nitronate monooxygenase [Corynebacterium incognita]|uniref:Propionate 3-nitronate monooxygenase n=1 Tax=Corynebacterium incognita TaxID=2754725 RepID=A0A7G7CNS6_9CORY|nr:nitronate monooxygenase [Corynebacterium incognita]QNE89242.1 nitronate monooxygenase [Corynebacterium incognita]
MIDVASSVLVAPMAGGPITPALIKAAEAAGSFAFLPLGRVAPQRARELLAELEGHRFGVNLFYPQEPITEEAEQWARALADELGVEYPDVDYTFDYAELVDAVLAAPTRPEVFSTMFGCPPAAEAAALQDAGMEVWATVTTPTEAIAARERGVDVIVVQAAAAGGHRGTWEVEATPNEFPLRDLVAQVHAALAESGASEEAKSIPPLVAAGGLRDAAEVAEALTWPGVAKVSCGSAFLLAAEAGTSPVNRALIRRGGNTVATRAFTGRVARGMETAFTRTTPAAPGAYPHLNSLLGRLRPSASLQDLGSSKPGELDYAYCLVGVEPERISGGSVAEVLQRLNK